MHDKSNHEQSWARGHGGQQLDDCRRLFELRRLRLFLLEAARRRNTILSTERPPRLLARVPKPQVSLFLASPGQLGLLEDDQGTMSPWNETSRRCQIRSHVSDHDSVSNQSAPREHKRRPQRPAFPLLQYFEGKPQARQRGDEREFGIKIL